MTEGGKNEAKLGFFGTLRTYTVLSARYTWSDVSKRPRNFCIGFWSVFTVVFFVGLILIALAKTPVVFLRFAELSVGEMDALVLAEGSVPFINYSAVAPAMDSAVSIEGSTPRWLLKGEIAHYSQKAFGNITRKMATNVVVIDSKREKEIGVGRAWPYRQIGYGETQVYHSALRFVNVHPNIGQRLRLQVDIAGILQQQDVNIPLGATNVSGAGAGAAVGGLPTVPVNLTELAQLLNGTGLVNGTALEPFTNGTTDIGTINISPDAVSAALGNLSFAFPGVESEILTQFLTPELRLVAADAIESTFAKYPAALGNALVLDYHDLLPLFLEQMCYSSLQQPFASVLGPNAPTVPGIPPPEELLQNFSLQEFTLVIVGMFTDRFSTYYMDRERRRQEMIRKSDELFLSLGVDFGGNVQYPVEAALQGFYFFELFLSSLFRSVVVVIAVLGALLVYTLLLTNSEERSFEVAIMRSQGMFRSQLAHLLFFQSSVFILPAIIMGMCILLAVNAILEIALTSFTAAPADTTRIDTTAMVVPLVFGFVVPIFANWKPTKRALLSSLRDALDIYRQTSSETRVTALKLAELGLEPWQTMVGWFLVIAGFLIYYMVPFSFIFDELWLFFFIMNIILLGMLFGLCLISYAFEGFVQRGALWLLLWGPEKKLWTLILRNLGSHKERNSKAYMMFTVSVACIIFGGVLFTLLANSIGQSIQGAIGADVVVQSLSFDFPLNHTTLTTFLEEQKASGFVVSYAFATFGLSNYPQMQGGNDISNIIGFPERGHRVVGVSESLFESVFSEFILVEELDDNYKYNRTSGGKPDVMQSMYVEPPVTKLRSTAPMFTGFPPNRTVPDVESKYKVILPCVMASSAKEILGLSAGSSGTLSFKYLTGEGADQTKQTSVFLYQPRALMNKFPGWPLMSSLSFTFSISTMLIPLPDFRTLLEPNLIDFPTNAFSDRYKLPEDAITEPQYERVFIKVPGWLQGDQLTDFVNLIQSSVNPYYHIPFDTADIVKQLRSTADLIIYFFFFVSAVATILCTFMLWLTFVNNVKLNAWIFAVLRSLGFTSNQLIRSFMYEALAIVLASFAVGTIIGIIIAYTLILQMNIFLQLPMVFAFPYGLFAFLFGLALVSAVLGSYLPTRSITRKSIASVLKSSGD